MEKFKTVNNAYCASILLNLCDKNYYSAVCLIHYAQDFLVEDAYKKLMYYVLLNLPSTLTCTDFLTSHSVFDWYKNILSYGSSSN